MGKIGIAITSFNRPSVIENSVNHWQQLAPKGAEIVVVDDGSAEPYPWADYAFPSNAGIAAAKNKCIEILMERGCTHLFLADSDTYPTSPDWYKPYIDSGVKHLSFTFDRLSTGKRNGRKFLRERDGLNEFESPCGCLMYVHKDVIDKIGGFDVDYPQWGFEHVDFSNRAYNAGLTPARYLDVKGSLELFHSMDYHCEVQGTLGADVRQSVIPTNKARFERNKDSQEFMPYVMGENGVVLASYFNSLPDPQRNVVWEPNKDALMPLIKSCENVGVPLKIFHDCLDVPDDDVFIRVPEQKEFSPNVYRWLLYRIFLEDKEYDSVFMVDSTDVEVLRNPFLSLNPNKLYVGNEEGMKVENSWMRRHQEPLLKNLIDYRDVIAANGDETLPNCGIVGGSYDIVCEYLTYRADYHEKYTKGITRSTDMAMFNYILWKHFKGRISTGIKVNTKFKGNEYNKISFFKHK